MRIFNLLLLKELKKAFSFRANYIFCLMFYSSILFLVSIGVSGQREILTNIAPGIIWVSVILVCFLSFEDVYHEDYNDGTLDIYLVENITLYNFSLLKSFSHWFSNCLPIIILTPLLGIFINLNEEIILPILVTLLAGTPALSFIGCMGASLTLSIKWHGLIMPIIILPLFIPVLIFGSGAISTILFSGLEELYFRQVAILSGISGLSAAFCPLISSYIIRTNYE
ncbi:MAG: heme exporter protein CcmB [Pseudomonadota bacterium]|nr:heme exporter protein CcmB [Pseudomonadota bacterium]MEC7830195.1 heme exporter protein CcmB [Pseudomonadota bacterium]MEC9382712.1 heme exporter protein CcmB [Pseudomonadota bacterium]MEC9414496.1 heme exporter protein CcmB [Pseudomonadota bacterium]